MASASLPANRWLVLVAVMLAFLPVVLDMTILHLAVPTLPQSLNASGTDVLWIIDIYPQLMAGLLVPMGTLADRVGNRKILLIGLVTFAVASAWAVFAQSPAMLIAARVLLALGGSMIMPCVLGLIRKTFEDDGERAMALGLWGMVGAAGAAVGPLVGGALLEHFGVDDGRRGDRDAGLRGVLHPGRVSQPVPRTSLMTFPEYRTCRPSRPSA